MTWHTYRPGDADVDVSEAIDLPTDMPIAQTIITTANHHLELTVCQELLYVRQTHHSCSVPLDRPERETHYYPLSIHDGTEVLEAKGFAHGHGHHCEPRHQNCSECQALRDTGHT